MTRQKTDRRGVALLLVIGLMAMLFITAVAFSVMNTVERSATVNYAHTVRARQMLYVGLADALKAVDETVQDAAYPPSPWILTTGINAWDRAHTNEHEILSSFSGVSNCVLAKVVTEEALSYIPRWLHSEAANAGAEYRPIEASGETIGRYAYVVVNVSGQLDANMVGSQSLMRWSGTNTGEITLSNNLPFEVTNTVTFNNDRIQDVRYESLEELGRLNTGVSSNKLSNFETFSYAPIELNPEGDPKTSLAYDPVLGGTLTNQFRTKHDVITNAFAKCGVQTAMNDARAPEWAYRALIDYVDTDSIPEGAPPSTDPDLIERLGRPASEDVPQIQSVALLNLYSRRQIITATPPATNYLHTVTNYLVIQCSRPFDATNILSGYTTYADVRLANPGTPAQWTSLLPLPPASTQSASNTSSFNGMGSAQPAGTFMHFLQYSNSSPNPSNYPQLKFNLAVRIRVSNASGEIVDQVPVAANAWNVQCGTSGNEVMLAIDNTFGLSQTNWNLSAFETNAFWAEAIDPAINWLGAVNNNQWIYSQSFSVPNKTLCKLQNVFSNAVIFTGAPARTNTFDTYQGKVRGNMAGGLFSDFLMVNSAALSWLYTNNTVGLPKILPDGATLHGNAAYWDPAAAWKRSFVKNRPLESIGELGYLKIGPWMTINLYPHEHATNDYSALPLPSERYHPVLDYFTLRATNGISRGLVNMNTRAPSVHAAIFNQMPINEWKGRSAAKCLTPTHAFALGSWFTSQLTNRPGCVITNLSHMGKFWVGVTNRGQANPASLPAVSRDAPVRTLAQALFNGSSALFGEFEREAIIRNAAELYTTRQQIYTIIVRADTTKTTYGGGSYYVNDPASKASVQGSARAVFQVWRDKEADANGNHPCFVRLCKVLE